jgi:hypothetical protein
MSKDEIIFGMVYSTFLAYLINSILLGSFMWPFVTFLQVSLILFVGLFFISLVSYTLSSLTLKIIKKRYFDGS